MSIVNSGGPDPVTRRQNWIMIGVAIAGLVVGLVGIYLGFSRHY
jgi:hypothetical protein